MELLLTLLAAAVGFIVYLLKDKQVKQAKQEAAILDLELKKQAKNQAAREAALRTATIRKTYEATKKDFLNKYKHLIDESNKPSSGDSK